MFYVAILVNKFTHCSKFTVLYRNNPFHKYKNCTDRTSFNCQLCDK